MTGVLESIAIGGAAWSAVEAYREQQERKLRQRQLITELFAKFFGKDFLTVAPDKTTRYYGSGASLKGGVLKSGTDTDVSSAYVRVSDFQEHRTSNKSLFNDLFKGGLSGDPSAEQRGDTITMICEYLKQWLITLPKTNELKAAASLSQDCIVDVKKHIEFSRQLLMRPKLFRNEKGFLSSIAYFCEHVDSYCDRLVSSERNASHCIDSVMSCGKEMVQGLLPIFLFSMGNIIAPRVSDGGTSSGNQSNLSLNAVISFDSHSLLRRFEEDTKSGNNLNNQYSGNSTASSATQFAGNFANTTINAASNVVDSASSVVTTAAAAASSQRTIFGSAAAAASSVAVQAGRSIDQHVNVNNTSNLISGGIDKDGVSSNSTYSSSKIKRSVAWDTHLGRLIYHLLTTPHFIQLMEGDIKQHIDPVKHPMQAMLQQQQQQQAQIMNQQQSQQQLQVNQQAQQASIQQQDPSAPCYLTDADANDPEYLAGYNFTSAPTRQNELSDEERSRIRSMLIAEGKDPSTMGLGYSDSTLRKEENQSAQDSKDDQETQSMFNRPLDKNSFLKGDFKSELRFVRQQWTTFLNLDASSGLLKPFRKLQDQNIETYRNIFLQTLETTDNLVYFLSVLQIYSKLSNLGGDPVICYLYSHINHLIHEVELVLVQLHQQANQLVHLTKITLQELSKITVSKLKESELRWMNNLTNIEDDESRFTLHKKLFELFTELRSLSSTERVPQLRDTIESNIRNLSSIVGSNNFQSRCRLPPSGQAQSWFIENNQDQQFQIGGTGPGLAITDITEEVQDIKPSITNSNTNQDTGTNRQSSMVSGSTSSQAQQQRQSQSQSIKQPGSSNSNSEFDKLDPPSLVRNTSPDHGASLDWIKKALQSEERDNWDPDGISYYLEESEKQKSPKNNINGSKSQSQQQNGSPSGGSPGKKISNTNTDTESKSPKASPTKVQSQIDKLKNESDSKLSSAKKNIDYSPPMTPTPSGDRKLSSTNNEIIEFENPDSNLKTSNSSTVTDSPSKIPRDFPQERFNSGIVRSTIQGIEKAEQEHKKKRSFFLCKEKTQGSSSTTGQKEPQQSESGMVNGGDEVTIDTTLSVEGLGVTEGTQIVSSESGPTVKGSDDTSILTKNNANTVANDSDLQDNDVIEFNNDTKSSQKVNSDIFTHVLSTAQATAATVGTEISSEINRLLPNLIFGGTVSSSLLTTSSQQHSHTSQSTNRFSNLSPSQIEVLTRKRKLLLESCRPQNQDEKIYYTSLWSFLSDEDDSNFVSLLHDISRFDNLVGRSKVSSTKLEIISSFVFLDCENVEQVSLAEFIVILRLLGHAQEMEKIEQEMSMDDKDKEIDPGTMGGTGDKDSEGTNGNEFPNINKSDTISKDSNSTININIPTENVIDLTTLVVDKKSLTNFEPLENPRIVRTAPKKLVEFEGIVWNEKAKRTKILEPI